MTRFAAHNALIRPITVSKLKFSVIRLIPKSGSHLQLRNIHDLDEALILVIDILLSSIHGLALQFAVNNDILNQVIEHRV